MANTSVSLIPLIAAALIAPGYVISFISSRFTTARPNFSAGLALSSIYYAFVYLVLGILCKIKTSGQLIDFVKEIDHIQVFLIVVIGPILMGTIAGHVMQKQWIYNFFRSSRWPNWFQISPANGILSAWDLKFLEAGHQKIEVHLKDGSVIKAMYEFGCFVSTDPNERDIYLNNIIEWKGKDGGIISIKNTEGVLLTGDSIRRIIFYPA